MINRVLLVLQLLVSMALLKCTNFSLVINSLNFVRLFHLQVLLVMIFPVLLVIFFHLQFLMITLENIILSFFFVSQIKNANISRKCLVSYDVTSIFTNILLQETIDLAINLTFNQNLNINIIKKELFSFLLHHRIILFLTVNLIITLMEQPWFLLQLLSLLITSRVLRN